MINLHVHDEKASLLDSILSVQDIVNFAKESGQESIAITNHGTMYSYVDFYKECKKKNIKPIIGCEVYEVNDMLLKNDTKDNKQQRFHLILLSKNQVGLSNLFKIVSDGFLKGFYGKPRVDLDYIERNNLGEGIICLTACMAGRLSKILSGKDNTYSSQEYIQKLKGIFDYVSLEIQAHNYEEQGNLNRKIIEIANETETSYVVTSDAHMLTKDQLDTHSIFIEIGTDREVGEAYNGCYLQTDKDVYENLDQYLTDEEILCAINETHKISNMIDEIDIGLKKGNLMPIIETPKEFNNNLEFFRNIIDTNFDKKFSFLSVKEREKRRDRIEMEIPILKELDYIDYFLMLVMLTEEAKKRKIPLGYSRGSGANCLCLYVLGVTQVDSVRWGLDFSRFANLGRKSVADFDMDISKLRRREMVAIAEELFGKEKVAPICTFNTLSTKVAIKDIGKVLDNKGIYSIPYSLRDEVAKSIPTIKTINDLGEEEEKEVLLKQVLQNSQNEQLKNAYEKYPLWFKYVMELEGKPKSLGRHAAGTIIAPKDLLNYAPLCLDSDGNQMLQIEMHNAMDDLGLCKMDFLGLETLDTIDECLKLIGKTWEEFDINKMDLDDKNVLKNIYAKGNTTGIFQMESAEAIKLCIDAETDNINDVIAINAFNRPGTKNGFPTYVKNKKFPNEVKVLHEDLRKIFEETHYVLLYQEQALKMFRHAGFEESEVDNARRAIGHKEKDTMKSLKFKFKEGLNKRGWEDYQVDEIWVLMDLQSEYCFNKGHSTAYGLLSYLTAYLKYYYPLEFMTACLNSKMGDTGRTGVLLNECSKIGIEVAPPNVNKSYEFYTPLKKENKILYGLYPIKGVGEVASKFIIENRPYKSFNDFYDRTVNIENSPINKTVIIALIKSGAIPCKSKNNMLLTYANKLFIEPKYKEVKTLPTKSKLLLDWNIDSDEFKSKDVVLKLYNAMREEKFNKEKENKYKKHIDEFRDKYISNEEMYEFDTLSMFLTNNPLKKYSEYITDFDLIEEGAECVVLSSIVDVKRKKDKRNNTFAYLDLYSSTGILEGIAWSSCYSKYQSYIKKGKHIAILGTKKEDKLIINDIKDIDKWMQDVNLKIN